MPLLEEVRWGKRERDWCWKVPEETTWSGEGSEQGIGVELLR